MRSRQYIEPAIKTLTTREILESLGPVSCGSGIPIGPGGALSPGEEGNHGGGGYQHM